MVYDLGWSYFPFYVCFLTCKIGLLVWFVGTAWKKKMCMASDKNSITFPCLFFLCPHPIPQFWSLHWEPRVPAIPWIIHLLFLSGTLWKDDAGLGLGAPGFLWEPWLQQRVGTGMARPLWSRGCQRVSEDVGCLGRGGRRRKEVMCRRS